MRAGTQGFCNGSPMYKAGLGKQISALGPLMPGRRAFIALGGVLLLGAALTPIGACAQASGGSKRKIGVIGSGHIGGTIGGLWAKAGHPILFSSRHPESLADLVVEVGS